MSSGYDYSTTTYSPDGKIFQTEYATKAVENSPTCIGLKVKGGVVLAAEKIIRSKLLLPQANHQIATIDKHCGMVCTGVFGDGIYLVDQGRKYASDYKSFYQEPIPAKILADRMGTHMLTYTLYASVRPFGSSAIVGIVDSEAGTPGLYMIEPSGAYWGYNACASGRGTRNAKNELEKLSLSTMTPREAVKEAARIMYDVHNASKDKEMELEITWICQESAWKHEFVPRELMQEAESYAKSSLEEKMQE